MMKNFSIALPPLLALPAEPIGADRDEIEDWLRLCHTPGVPLAAVRRLLSAFGPPGAVFAASRSALADVVPVEIVTRLLARTSGELGAQIARTLEWADRPGCAVVTLSEPAYPRAVLAFGDAPPILYCRGDAGLPNRAHAAGELTAALVGSRRATPQGCDNARHFANVLGDAGVTVVSGLAAGIDASAHEGALATTGGTCAVIGTGADIVYPFGNRALAERIASHGLLLSAFPIGTPPRPEHFPRRNRLIAALARCTVVIEAAPESGSLITARLAGDLGRDVLAVPGSIHALQSRGCHALIRDGATLATSPEDVLEALGMAPAVVPTAPARRDTERRRPVRRSRTANVTSKPGDRADAQGHGDGNVSSPPLVHAAMASEPVTWRATGQSPGTAAVLEALGYDPVNADTLCKRTGLGIAAVLAQLGVLELDGRVARLPGGRFMQHKAARTR